MPSAHSITLMMEGLLFICGLISFGGVFFAYFEPSPLEAAYLASIGKNWETGVVLKTSSDVNCLNDNKTALISRPWPGTVTGCYKYLILNRGYCTSSKSSSKGTTIPSFSPSPYLFWRQTPLCSSRIQASYFDLVIVSKEVYCSTGYKSCGIIDTAKNYLCVPNNQECPINYFKILGPNDKPPTDFPFETISLNGATLVYSNSNKNGEILVEIDLDEDQPCANPYNKHYKSQPFILEKYYDRYDCTYPVNSKVFDPFYKYADEYSYFNTYAENRIITTLSVIPGFINYSSQLQTSNRKLQMFHRNYFGIHTDCIKEIKDLGISEQIIKDMKSLDAFAFTNITTSLGAAFIFACIGLVFICIYFPILFYKILIHRLNIDSVKMRAMLILYIGLYSLSILILSWTVLANTSNFGTSFLKLVELNCVDQNLQNSIRSTIQSSSGIISNMTYSLTFSVLSVILGTAVFILERCCF
jgi:hypothetical protein